jgi:hypothetical protein
MVSSEGQGQEQEQEQGQGQEQEQGQGQDGALAYAFLATPYFPGFSIMSPSMRPTSSESEMIGAISC